MSHEIVKSISIKKDKVFINSADSSVRPLHYYKWECSTISDILVKEGREAALARIGRAFWDGEFHLNKGSGLNNLFLQARSALPHNLSFNNYDGEVAGQFLAKMVMKLEKDPYADLSGDVKDMLNKMNDREYILHAAKTKGYNFLNFANKSVQKDRDFALEVVKSGAGCAWFDFPPLYSTDREVAAEAVKLNGCHYRSLDKSLQADRELILMAFAETPGKSFHEHLPDLIPLEAYCDLSPGKALDNLTEFSSFIDAELVCQLLDVCPSLHMSRAPWLLERKEIALKWCEVGKWFPYDVKDLPEKFLNDKDFQDVLTGRFAGTDKYDILAQKFADRGVALRQDDLDSKIAAAESNQVGHTESRAIKESFIKDNRDIL